MDQSSFIQSISTINCDLIPPTEPSNAESASNLVRNVCNHVLTNGPCEKSKELIEILDNFLIYPDVKYLVLKSLLNLFKATKSKVGVNVGEDFITVAFDLISLIKLEAKDSKRVGGKRKWKSTGSSNCSTGVDVLFKKSDDSGPLFTPKNLCYENQADLFASVWFNFLTFKLSLPIYRSVLKMLDTKVIPHFRNPLSLSDFLISSFNIGGSASVLALSSLYILISKCNLEYPNFYKKFYSLITADMLHVKYRARFFYWTDIFLTSTHIPGYLVAAFVKKLARLTLIAPIDAITIILPVIKNALVRHPSLIVMMNKYSTGIDSDPYDISQDDPVNSNAMESSLWELSTLQYHWNTKIASGVHFIKQPLPSKETDLSELLETTFTELQAQSFKALDKTDYDMHINQELRESLRKFVQV
ncbi:nucleolar complex protein 4 homolog [Panonychus citri]|uniref:nucleolar complex protein 4 homolog n=1 Tax=Panonychus citri TaxID=50023 RepID=UPI0023072A0A|nr:nucleolar complex protein 4 homolog [Panonychus citri]